MAGENLRVVAIALAAFATVWPATMLTRLGLFAGSGFFVVSASWSATFGPRQLDWGIALVVLMAIGLGWAMFQLYAVFTTPMYTWFLFASCLGAVYVCVPENDQINEIGLLFVCAGTAELLTGRRLPLAVWSAAATAMLWSAMYGASGQGRAMIGGLFAMMPIIAVAIFVSWARSRFVVPEVSRWLVAAIWVVAAWTVARTGGIASTATAAWIAVAIVAPIAVLMSFGIQRFLRVGVQA